MFKIEDLTQIFQWLNYRFDFNNDCNSRIKIYFTFIIINLMALLSKKKKSFFFSWFSLYLVKPKPGRWRTARITTDLADLSGAELLLTTKDNGKKYISTSPEKTGWLLPLTLNFKSFLYREQGRASHGSQGL